MSLPSSLRFALTGLLLALSAGTMVAPTHTRAADTTLHHALETQALVDPDAVLQQLPALIAQAQQSVQFREEALLHLAHANACRVIANWRCQRDAGIEAARAARLARDPALEVRGLIAESRAHIALQDYTLGERRLGEAELRLAAAPLPELAAEIDLAYSSMSHSLAKHALAVEYAQRGLKRLGEDEALPTQVRLLRNQARAQAQLDQFETAKVTLTRALALSERVVDPKLRAELFLESGRLARRMGDIPAQREHARHVIALGQDLRNSQLAGQGHEALGLAALDAGDHAEALRELYDATTRFRDLSLARDELRSSRTLIDAMLAAKRPVDELEPVLRRSLELDSEIMRVDRAQAADDFDARLQYAQRENQVLRLESEAALAQERERLSRFINILSIAVLVLVVGFVLLQRRSHRRLTQTLRALKVSESRATELLRLSAGLVFLHDLDGRVLLMNPAAGEALGISAADVAGRDMRDFIPPDGRAAFETYVSRLRAQGAAEGKVRVRRADGSVRYWHYDNRVSADESHDAYVIGHAVDVTEQLAETEVLRERSERDALTGAYNRRHLEEFEQRQSGRWGVVNVDLDHFKQINDSLGHERGDQVLVEVAQFLQQRVREGDAVVRSGGDEFLLLLADGNEAALLALVERLQTDAAQAPCGLSLGWALREDAEALSETLARADRLMYERRAAARAARREGRA